MNNVIQFPAPPRVQQQPTQGTQKPQINPMQMIMGQFMQGINPERILDQMTGPEVKQARQIIHGKNPNQLKSIAYNMAQQRGVRLEDLAATLGVNLP